MANCVVTKIVEEGRRSYNSFEFDNINFSHWYFNPNEGHRKDFWLVKSEVRAKDYKEAFKKFTKKLNDIVPKIALLSQCYAEYFREPFLIHKLNNNIAFFRYSRTCPGVRLHFNNNSLKALEKLDKDKSITNEFFYYWNDMVNALGYSAKLLLLCSALEALAKSKVNGGKNMISLQKF